MAGIGPALPPHLAAARTARAAQAACSDPSEPAAAEAASDASSQSSSPGPSLGPSAGPSVRSPAGPERPPRVRVGPQRPAPAAGPELPPALAAARLAARTQAVPEEGDADSDSDSDSDPGAGPAPPPAGVLQQAARAQEEDVLQEIEMRAAQLKRVITNAPEDAHRDTWMTELPESFRKTFDAGASRGFRQQYGAGGSDSSWTDTPEDRERRREERAERQARGADAAAAAAAEAAAPSLAKQEREAEIKAQVEVYNAKRRSESLMEQHARKRRHEFREKAQQGGDEPVSRRFDPAKDLVNKRISAQQREDLLAKASTFGTRFTSGSYS